MSNLYVSASLTLNPLNSSSNCSGSEKMSLNTVDDTYLCRVYEGMVLHSGELQRTDDQNEGEFGVGKRSGQDLGSCMESYQLKKLEVSLYELAGWLKCQK